MAEIVDDHYRIAIGSQVVDLPLIPLGERTAISLLMTIDHGVAFGEAAGADLAGVLADSGPDIVASAATLGIPVAIEVSRHLGLDDYLILQKTPKVHLGDALSEPLSSITTEGSQRLLLDRRRIPAVAGKRVALVDDVIATGGSIAASARLLRAAGAEIVAIGSFLVEGSAWRTALGADAGADRSVVTASVVLVDADTVLSPGWLVVADGTIESVGRGQPPPGLPVVATGDLAMPGLVSAHQHAVDLLVAGGPTGPTFLDWLLGTYHAGLALADPEGCAAAIGAVRAATLAAGVTTMVDCWSVGPVDDAARSSACADASIEAHRASGGRTVFAVMGNEHPAPGWHDAGGPIDIGSLCRPHEETLLEVERLAAAHHRSDGGRTLVAPSPELPETATAAGLQAALGLATRLDVVLPMHLCASPPSRRAYGPAELERDGLAGPRLLAAHVSAIDAADVTTLGRAGIGVAHCPRSSQALGGATPTPLAALRRAGARGAFGLDNASLNPSRDLFAEARAAIGWSHVAGDPLGAVTAFRLLTAEGADAAGLGRAVGRLTVGRRADVALLDTSGPHWWPRRGSWVETVVASATAADVTTVLVDGRLVVRDGEAVVGADQAALERAAAAIAATRGWRRSGPGS